MQTITLQCEVPVDRIVTVKLPQQVEPGLHEFVLVFDRLAKIKALPDSGAALVKLAGSVPSFASVDGVVWQRAIRDEWA